MIRLDQALRAWGTPDFMAILKQKVAQLGADQLPLQQGLSTGNYVSSDPVTVAINSVAETEKIIRVKAGIFYQGVMGGCSCADDPTPIGKTSEYCEVQLEIDKATAATAVALVTEQADY
jgi:hypothetical protein